MGQGEIWRRVHLLMVSVTVLISSNLVILELMEGKKFGKMSPEQRAIVKRIQENRVEDKEIHRNFYELSELHLELESGKKAMEGKDPRKALDHIINAKGHMEKINPLVFDTKELRNLARELERQLGNLLLQGE